MRLYYQRSNLAWSSRAGMRANQSKNLRFRRITALYHVAAGVHAAAPLGGRWQAGLVLPGPKHASAVSGPLVGHLTGTSRAAEPSPTRLTLPSAIINLIISWT